MISRRRERQAEARKVVGAVAPGKDTLAIYSFMFGPERERPCPGCTHFLYGLDGASRHIYQRFNLAVVAKSPLPRILSFAKERGWRWLQPLSTAGNTYDRDYFGDSTSLAPHPYGSNKNSRTARSGICESGMCSAMAAVGSVTSGVPSCSTCLPSPGRSTGTTICSTLWNMFDLAPDGRGDFQPKLDYTSGSGK